MSVALDFVSGDDLHKLLAQAHQDELDELVRTYKIYMTFRSESLTALMQAFLGALTWGARSFDEGGADLPFRSMNTGRSLISARGTRTSLWCF